MARIALVTHGFGGIGGVQSVAKWLRQALIATGNYEVDLHDLATSSRDPLSRGLTRPTSWSRSSLRGTSDDRIPFYRWGANAVELEGMRYRPRRELTSALKDYDLIQVVSGSPAWAASVTNQGIPVVLQAATLAAWERDSQKSSWPIALRAWRKAMTTLTSKAEEAALRDVDAVLVENNAMLDYVRSIGQNRAIKAPPGIDTDTFFPSSEGWRSTGYILSVCRLNDSRKGLDRMVVAYASLTSRNSNVPRLVLAGRGPMPPKLSELINTLGLKDKVDVLIDVDPANLPVLYRGASLFVQTSHEEGLGLSVLEAMASGLPVISTETNGSCELILNGVTGWLVPQEPDEDIPKRFSDLINNLLESNGTSFAIRARERCVREFSSEATLRRFTNTYQEILTGSTVAPV